MGQDTQKGQWDKSAFSCDPRLYQIASLSALLLYGLLWLYFELSAWQIMITIGTALLT